MAKQSRSRVGDFEKSLKELETIVERMENPEQSLETSLKDFERGMNLVRHCRDNLREAEARVQQLLEKEGGVQSIPFDPDTE
ncbi:MAG: exodeoxyribonuclease VII small subunit [Acidiferrobacteraceae bacterium]|nr:exodeoxyribonuclease VII small subunit [Acidiferrobacteraceae bacterium]MCP4827906.1 exodeoxyribonuclease VII small subunit [Pseudomonadota bacterium]